MIERHCREIVDCERVSVVFYDQKRGEIYRRVKRKDCEEVECMYPPRFHVR